MVTVEPANRRLQHRIHYMAPIVSESPYGYCNRDKAYVTGGHYCSSSRVELEEVNGRQRALVKLNIDGFKPDNIVVTIVENKLVLFSWSEGEKEQNELNHVYHMPKNTDLLDAEATLLNNGDLTIAVPVNSDTDPVDLYICEKYQVVLTRLLNNKPCNTKTLYPGGKRGTILNTIRAFSNLNKTQSSSSQTTTRTTTTCSAATLRR